MAKNKITQWESQNDVSSKVRVREKERQLSLVITVQWK